MCCDGLTFLLKDGRLTLNRPTNFHRLFALGIGMGLASLAIVTHADTTKGLLYVSDYGKSVLDRYQYTYDQATNKITAITAYGIGNNTSNAFFLGGSSAPVKEGVHGTANDLIVVGGSHGNGVTNITRYDLNGNLIGTIPINFSSYNGGNVGIGNVLVTPDGKFLYAPLETAGYVVKVDLRNGNIVANYQFAGAHDIAIAPNGDVYAANYNDGNAKVIRLDSNLNYKQDLIAHSSGFRPTGLSIAADGSLYVDDNTKGGSDSVQHYKLTNNNGTLTATLDPTVGYVGSASNNALDFTFGNNIGPDGRLYIAALGGGGNGSFGVTANYQDGIYAFDPTNNTVSQFIQGYTEKNGPDGLGGLSAPKYLQFDINFVKANDIGVVPEPGNIAMLGGLIVTGVGFLNRRKRVTK